MVMLSMTLGDL